jgi:hypothetical protein
MNTLTTTSKAKLVERYFWAVEKHLKRAALVDVLCMMQHQAKVRVENDLDPDGTYSSDIVTLERHVAEQRGTQDDLANAVRAAWLACREAEVTL